MFSTDAKPVGIAVSEAVRISGLLQTPSGARACYVLAHGAGAGMDHPFMVAVAQEPKANVCFGSKADICSAKSYVRFASNRDRKSGFPQTVMSALPLKADICGAS